VAGSNIGIGALPGTTNLYVVGNAFFTNALTTSNILTTNVNVSGTSNILTLIATSNIGIGTNPGTTNLYVQGNVFVSNALVTTNIIAGNMLYGRDLTKSYPHLVPDSTNAASIQNWISTTCNIASKPRPSYWSTSQEPAYGNVVGGPQNDDDYSGGVYLPDGRVLFVPHDASNVGFFNPVNGTFTTVSAAGISTAGAKFRGGVLVPNGNVIFVPQSSANVGVYNPVSSKFSNIGRYNVGTNGFESGVLARNGKVIFIPHDSPNVGIFDYTTLTMSNLAIQGTNQNGFTGGVLLPNGNVAFIPAYSRNVGMLSADQSTFSNIGPFFTATASTKFTGGTLAPDGNVIMTPGFLASANVAVFNPTNSTCSNVRTNVVGTDGAFQGAALLPSGNIIFAPCTSRNIGTFDPVLLTYSNLNVVGLSNQIRKFYGATLIPDGRVVFTPMRRPNVCVLSTFVTAPPEFCLSPYFNKL
jgi:hypothetical protein